jgi:hypothetical protein
MDGLPLLLVLVGVLAYSLFNLALALSGHEGAAVLINLEILGGGMILGFLSGHPDEQLLGILTVGGVMCLAIGLVVWLGFGTGPERRRS